jgi:hypothetical protein
MGPFCRAILVIGLIALSGCNARRPTFITRVRQDCAAGQQWACDLLDVLSRPPSSDDTTMPDGFSGDRPVEPPSR